MRFVRDLFRRTVVRRRGKGHRSCDPQAWSQVATPGGANVGYLTIENKGPEADRRIGGSADAAAKIQGIHTASAGTKQLMMMMPR